MYKKKILPNNVTYNFLKAEFEVGKLKIRNPRQTIKLKEIRISAHIF
jgi:hypothetical protein